MDVWLAREDIFHSNANKRRLAALAAPQQRLAITKLCEGRGESAGCAMVRGLMRSAKPAERRKAPRRLISRMAKIQLGNGTLPRDCLITDISTGGVRLHVEGYEVPDDFVLLLYGDDLAKECNYQVIWRLGQEIGARFVGLVRRPGFGARG